ncbi:AMIN-like domain-containing (lipo)protein [Enemella sp. A6]|uniref:AMIN-like domain-containing (lipo)protein n=1 Tax=Enemella sp. A6 TaxID=3440152 RepID=UPI003EB7CF71
MTIRRAVPAVVLMLVLGLAACGPNDPGRAPSTDATSERATEPSSERPTESAGEPGREDSPPPGRETSSEPRGDESSEPSGRDPGQGFSNEKKQTKDFPDLPDTTLLPVAVRVAHQEGFDRVVVEFSGEGQPGYRVQYVEQAAAPGSGEPVDLPGSDTLEVIITGTRYPEEGEKFAGRDDEYPVNDAKLVRGVEFFPPYEGQSQLVIGVSGQAPFRVQVLDGPPRLVIDIDVN